MPKQQGAAVFRGEQQSSCPPSGGCGTPLKQPERVISPFAVPYVTMRRRRFSPRLCSGAGTWIQETGACSGEDEDQASRWKEESSNNVSEVNIALRHK